MLQAVEAIIHPDGTVRLLENLTVTRPTRVVLTLLPGSGMVSVWDSGKGRVEDTLAFLKSERHRLRPAGDPAAMEQVIQEYRDEWD
ncbi:MAG TPA: hypothetical protein PLB10_01215 [Thiolinea sp.]|nr:hypothetical protein [Thiolinea sp.]